MAVAITQTANPAGVNHSGGVVTYSGLSIGTAAADRIVVVLIGSEAGDEPSEVTIGGNAATKATGTTLGTTTVDAYIYYRAVPTGTTADVVISSFSAQSTNHHIAVYSVTGAASPPTAGNDTSDDMDATDPLTTGSTTIAANGGMLAVAAGSTDANAKTWANLTEDIDADAGALRFTTASSTTAGTATRTCTGTQNGEDGALAWVIFAASVTNITLTADSGSFTFTGTAATLKYGREVAADSGSFAFSGTAATLRRTYRLDAGSGAFVFTGTAADMIHVRRLSLSADAGSFFFTGTAASLEYGRVLGADSGSFSFTGTAATLRRTYQLVAGSGAFAFTGTDVTLRKTWILAPDSGAFLFTGSAAMLLRGIPALAAESGSFVFTGTAATLERGYEITAGAGQFYFNGGAEVTLAYSGEVVSVGSDWIVRNRHRGRR